MVQDEAIVGEEIVNCDFVKEKATKLLRVCCYGSSSSKTPLRYLNEARNLGYILAKRGHTCVNGAGSFGCMAAMNEGAAFGNGHIVGVIHEMFLVDTPNYEIQRDGGAHPVFENAVGGASNRLKSNEGLYKNQPIREILVASGNDLQERKRLLVDKANALVVLPGGPGTWDELWEMACARQIGLSTLPIVCVNIDGFYEPFRKMLERAEQDQLLQMEPSKIVHFEATAEDAVRWIESASTAGDLNVTVKKRSQILQSTSVLHDPSQGKLISYIGNILFNLKKNCVQLFQSFDLRTFTVFVTGAGAGILISKNRRKAT